MKGRSGSSAAANRTLHFKVLRIILPFRRQFIMKPSLATLFALLLIGAARSGDARSITALLAGGADPNQRWGVNHWTPLMHAIHKYQRASVEALIAGGADVNARSPEGLTALIMAAGYGYSDIVQIL